MQLAASGGPVLGTETPSRTLRPFGSDFASAALKFLEDSSLEMKPEYLQVLELILDRVTGSAGCVGDEAVSDSLEEEEEGDRIGDVLVAAFEAAATRLSRMEAYAPDSKGLLRVCGRLIDTLLRAGAADWDAMNQRSLWRELLCQQWGEVAAGLALEMLLLKAQLTWTTCSTADEAASMQGDEILDVVAFAYAHLPTDLKEFCFDQVSALISTLVHEGPTYRFTPRMVLQLRLLECLTDFQFLDVSDDLDVTAWLEEYFTACFDCCGVAIQLLSDHQSNPSSSNANDSVGVIRMVNMCLLVIKAGFDYFETRRKDIEELARILSPLIVESLAQPANFPPTHFPETRRGASPEAIKMCFVEISLQLLAKMVGVLKESDCDALVNVFQALLTPRTISRFKAVRPSLVSACFDTIHQLISHPKVAEVVGTPLTALLDLSELGDGNTMTKPVCSVRDPNATNAACVRSTNSDRGGEDAFSRTTPESVAMLLLSNMDFDDTGMVVPEDRAIALSQDQLSSAVLRPDAPQWFDEEDSDDEDSATELPRDDSDTQSDQSEFTRTNVVVPQWFGDDDDDDAAADVELPLEDSVDYPKLAFLLGPDHCDRAAKSTTRAMQEAPTLDSSVGAIAVAGLASGQDHRPSAD
ncbi:hypothetical protein PF005_g26006 [Phytophthora fragariae]|uniref:Uncharacterized protein n=1 Tax=Phytophthora fragariae TaxID=53985 RepID=A0A6A3EBA4_9STRA|nr:hypothetical protein PF003_g39262 [Phytophthora fragariae]KAE8927308.1 hypothetical protein PF009_g22526 [Phytophthora fragariae]KAE8973773.1 hypothetical protein PF011_g25121 [Phytophthora fragariae]KAE9082169.1 hypothetical protein PF007_g22380 [Phytophthora fragariae]KAE9089094.1 hypothetical protein PF010_g19136 [Phytophthora fragariae]